jgi:hypothetical protein
LEKEGDVMFSVLLLFAALLLCLVAAVCLVMGFVMLISKRPKPERLLGLAAVLSSVVSYSIYYDARMIQSGGTFADWRVVAVSAIYAAALVLGLFIIGHSQLKLRKR